MTRRLAMLSIFASLNAAAQPLALVNPSFEQSLDGWSTFPPDGPGLASVIDPFVYGARPVRAPHGTSVLVLYGRKPGQGEFGVRQTLSVQLEANKTYQLRVSVGYTASLRSEFVEAKSQKPLYAHPGYRVVLRAGDTPLGGDKNSTPLRLGTFSKVSIKSTVGATHAELGKPLVIELISLNVDAYRDEINFDDVALEVTSTK